MKFFSKVVIIGATSVIAHNCARILAENNTREFVLVGRNLEKLESIKKDIQVRGSKITSIELKTMDFTNVEEIQKLVDEQAAVNLPDLVLIAHGYMPEQKLCQENLVLTKEALEVNGVSPVLFAEAFAEKLQNCTKSTIAVIGSVAGDRGRMTNYVYGAGKGLIETFMQGLTHRFGLKGPKICLIKPGPTRSEMTKNIESSKLAEPIDVANTIVKGISSGKRVIYAPTKWALIMFVVRNIPSFIFKYIKL